MKKQIKKTSAILLVIMSIILITVFTACNMQENTQETSNAQTDIQSSETIANEAQPQTEQIQTKEYIGEWKYSEKIDSEEFGSGEINKIISINDDNTFSLNCDYGDLDLSKAEPSYNNIIPIKITGSYIEEDDNKIKLIAKEATYYYPLTKETKEAHMESETDNSSYIYFSVKDNNTLTFTIDETDETVEYTRIR